MKPSEDRNQEVHGLVLDLDLDPFSVVLTEARNFRRALVTHGDLTGI